MAQLHRHASAWTAKILTVAHAEASSMATIFASAQESSRSLACPLVFQSRSVHLRSPSASQKAYSVHLDAAKERQNTSSSAFGRRACVHPDLTCANWQPSTFYSSAAADALSTQTGTRNGKHGTPSKHRGGPQPAVAAKESWPRQYQQIGSIEGKYSIPRKPVFAVIELGATQYKVSPGDLVVTEKLRHVDVNEKIKISRVLMLGSRFESIIGRPLVPGAYVTAAIEEQFQDAKVLIFKKRRRKNSRRLTGHRQDLTSVRIVDIEGIEAEPTLDSSGATAIQQEAKAA